MQRLGTVLKDLGPEISAMLKQTAVLLPGSTSHVEPAAIHCPRCRGAGWLRRDLDVADPQFGKLIRCVCADAIESAQRGAGLEDGTGGPRSQTFAAFIARPGTEEALTAAFEWADSPDGWLVLLGGTGTGKSHLLAAITNRLIERGESPRYWPAIPLLGWLRDGFADGADPPYAARLRRIADTGLLLLDDVGAENTTPWVAERWQEILDERYAGRRPTVLASNLTPDRLEDQLGQRIRSRLEDRRLVRLIGMTAEDIRPLLTREEVF